MWAAACALALVLSTVIVNESFLVSCESDRMTYTVY